MVLPRARSRARNRRATAAPAAAAIRVSHGRLRTACSRQPMPELPAVADAFPEMGRAGFVAQFGEAFGLHLDVLHDFLEVSLRNFAVELVDQRDPFLARDVP